MTAKTNESSTIETHRALVRISRSSRSLLTTKCRCLDHAVTGPTDNKSGGSALAIGAAIGGVVVVVAAVALMFNLRTSKKSQGEELELEPKN